MRARAVLLVLAILVVAAFAALNWPEFVRTSPLSFGTMVREAPLGLVMLGALAVTVVLALLAGAMERSRTLLDSRANQRELERQRTLAEKAEASRFTELRHHFDTHLRDLRQRDAIAATEFEKAMVGAQRDLRTQMEAMSRAMMSRLQEMETRLDARLSNARMDAVAAPTLSERDALRDADRLRDDRLREERVMREQEHARAEADPVRDRRL